jgi:hypothetical protein
VEYLKSPNIEIVELETKLSSAIDAESKQKECDFVIYAQVSHKKGGGFGFGKMLGQVVSQTPLSNTRSVAENVAGQVATAKGNGGEIITTVIEQAAEAIV